MLSYSQKFYGITIASPKCCQEKPGIPREPTELVRTLCLFSRCVLIKLLEWFRAVKIVHCHNGICKNIIRDPDSNICLEIATIENRYDIYLQNTWAICKIEDWTCCVFQANFRVLETTNVYKYKTRRFLTDLKPKALKLTLDLHSVLLQLRAGHNWLTCNCWIVAHIYKINQMGLSLMPFMIAFMIFISL